jgi:membrane associated rhomboid family serine protease
MFNMPPVTQLLIIINVLVFFSESYAGGLLATWFALWPIGEGFKPWQILSYAFLHANLSHLFFNMYGLWMFGSEIERAWGSRRLLTFYLASVLGAAGLQLLVSYLSGGVYPTVGASGGIFGLLLAFAMVFPDRIIVLLIPPIPLPAWLFATLYALIELVLGVTGTEAGVAHFGHLGGMLGGYLLIQYWRRKPPYGGVRYRYVDR